MSSTPDGVPPLWGLAVGLRNAKPGADAPRLYDITASRLGRPARVEVLVHLRAQQKRSAQAIQDDAINISLSPRQDWAASPYLPRVLKFVASGVNGLGASRRKSALPKMAARHFFSLSGDREVGRHKKQ